MATAVVGGIAGLFVLWSGIIDVAATSENALADKLLGYASTRSIRRHAPKENNPLASDAAAQKRGLEHYREMCVVCHGGPGAAPAEYAAGLHPSAPDLASPAIQS